MCHFPSRPDQSNISAPMLRRAIDGGGHGLHAYVDRSIVEAIADNATAITARVFPQCDDSTSIRVLLAGGLPSSANGTCSVTAVFKAWALEL